MKPYVEDIICAQSSPSGKGAVSILKVSGKGSKELLLKLLAVSHVEPRQAEYHKVYFEDKFIDEVLSLYFEEGLSFTGESSFEIHCHGSPLIVSRFIEIFCSLGARIAEPGEFSYRAYVNGKMDLTKAEGIHHSIQAQSELSQTLSMNLLEGSFKKKVEDIRELLLWAASRVEASIDFSDQDIDLDHDQEIFEKIKNAEAKVSSMLASYKLGLVQSKGIKVVLVGAPNSGKSTLFNNLLEEDRSIVSDQKGTTRDYIKQSFTVEGHEVELVDTAGLRQSQDQVESLGISRTLDLIKSQAQLILFLVSEDTFQSSQNYFSLVKESEVPYFIVHTKQDLGKWESNFSGEALTYSQGSMNSLLDLKEALARKLAPYFDAQAELFLERHRDLFFKAHELLLQILQISEIQGHEDVISSLVYSALEFMDEVLYIEDPEAVRDKIFKEFCLGK